MPRTQWVDDCVCYWEIEHWNYYKKHVKEGTNYYNPKIDAMY